MEMEVKVENEISIKRGERINEGWIRIQRVSGHGSFNNICCTAATLNLIFSLWQENIFIRHKQACIITLNFKHVFESALR